MPQGYGKPVSNTRPNPYRLRQDLGYVPARAMAEGDSGGGITSTGGPTSPVLTLTPIALGDVLANIVGANPDVPVPTPFVFTNLQDVPHSYTGQAGKVVTVNATEDGLEFDPAGSGGAVAVEENGTLIDATAATLNFTGVGVTVTDTSPGLVQIDIGGSGGSAFQKSIPNGFTLIPPVAADFTFQQADTTHGALTVLAGSPTKGMSFGQSVTNSGTAYFFLVDEPVVSQTDFIVTALVHANGLFYLDNFAWGICATDSAGKVYEWGWRNAAGVAAYSEFEYSPFSTLVSAPVNSVGAFDSNDLIWLKLQLTGGNFIFSMSWDGENYFVLSTQSKTTFLGATLSTVGFHSFDSAGVLPLRFNVYHWTNTTSAAPSKMLLESGDSILTETSDHILLE